MLSLRTKICTPLFKILAQNFSPSKYIVFKSKQLSKKLSKKLFKKLSKKLSKKQSKKFENNFHSCLGINVSNVYIKERVG